jgi:ribosomal protein S18 acetylase RimI-like enzyme
MKIRPATPGDAAALARAHIDSRREAYRGLVPAEHLSSLDYERRAGSFRNAIANKLEDTYCAEESGDLLGFVTLGPCRDADLDTATTGEVWGIYLPPKHWRKGVGKELCTFAEKLLTTRRYQCSVLWVFEANSQARRFYEAMGYERDNATSQLTVGGAKLTAMRYRKTLPRSNPPSSPSPSPSP